MKQVDPLKKITEAACASLHVLRALKKMFCIFLSKGITRVCDAMSFIARGSQGKSACKASPGFISKTNIPIPPQKAAIPKIRINRSWTSIF